MPCQQALQTGFMDPWVAFNAIPTPTDVHECGPIAGLHWSDPVIENIRLGDRVDITGGCFHLSGRHVIY